MSHFTVGVIVKDKYELTSRLAPYSECDEEYFIREPYMTKEEYIESYRRYHEDCDLDDSTIWNEEAPKEYRDIEDDTIYTGYNPDAKWDWYELGGRWTGSLITSLESEYEKGGHYGTQEVEETEEFRFVDAAKIKDVLWNKMNEVTPEHKKELSDFWDKYVINHEEDEEFRTFYKPEYYKETYGTKDNYINKSTMFYTHDLLLCPEDEDSEWLTVGDMGWFGCDNATEESMEDYVEQFYKIIKDPKYADYWFIMVDCHI